MLTVELKRYLKSPLNIVILFFLFCVIFISFSSTYANICEWREQINSSAEDISNEMIFEIIEGYKGITFLTWLFFGAEETFQLVLVFVIGFSVMFGSNIFDFLHGGFGNKIITRTSYRSHLSNTLFSQIIYMCAFIFLFVGITSATMLVLFPQDWSFSPSNTLSFKFQNNLDFLKMLLLQTLLIISLVVPLVSLTSVTPVLTSNKYLNMSIPVIYIIVTHLLANTISNFSPIFAQITRRYDVSCYMVLLYDYNQSLIQGLVTPQIIQQTIIDVILLPGTLIVISFVLSALNIKRFGRDYLK